MKRPVPTSPDPEQAQRLEECLAAVRAALGRLRYGEVTVTVHEGRAVQLEITEKQRLPPP